MSQSYKKHKCINKKCIFCVYVKGIKMNFLCLMLPVTVSNGDILIWDMISEFFINKKHILSMSN